MIRNLNLVGGDRWRSPPPNRTARSLRTQVLPHASFRRPISGDCPCLVGVALPSGNGGCFMTSGYRQKLGQCAMPGTHEYHQWTGGIHFWHLMRMYIWLANHNRHKSIPTCVGPISLPEITVSISCDILHQLLVRFIMSERSALGALIYKRQTFIL
jgi:hypothetical protein